MTTAGTPMYSGQVRTIQATGVAGIPSENVSAVVLDIAASSSATTWVRAIPSGSGEGGSQLSVVGGTSSDSNTVIVRVNSVGKIDIRVGAGPTQLTVDVQGYVSTASSGEGGGFVALQPARIARSDTADGFPNTNPLGGGGNYLVQVAGVAGIPEDATGVFANVRVFAASGPGVLRAGTSNAWLNSSSIPILDYRAALQSDSAAMLALGTDGAIRIYGQPGTTYHVSIDVQGYVTPTDDGVPFTPVPAATVWVGDGTAAPMIGAEETREISVTGVAGIPEADQVSAVMITVAAYNWSGSAGLVVYNPDEPTPSAVALGVNGQYAGSPQRATVAVPVSESGTIAIWNHGAQPIGVSIYSQGYFGYNTESVGSEEGTEDEDGPDDAIEGEQVPSEEDQAVFEEMTGVEYPEVTAAASLPSCYSGDEHWKFVTKWWAVDDYYIPIRCGYWSSSLNKGWGVHKLKHYGRWNTWYRGMIGATLANPDQHWLQGGTTWIYVTRRFYCEPGTSYDDYRFRVVENDQTKSGHKYVMGVTTAYKEYAWRRTKQTSFLSDYNR